MTKTRQSLPIYRDVTHSIAERAEDLIARMTLEEKIAQLGSLWVYELQDEQGFSVDKAAARISLGIGQITRIGGGSTLTPPQIATMSNMIQSYLIHHTRLGIPALVHEECCSGYMALGATCFPQIIGLASTWAPELAEQMTEVIRRQMRAVGAHQGLAPVLDVSRDPRWGRVEETFGEDPLLAAQMGVAYVRGLQSENLREGVIATGKHFAAHGLSEAGMNCTPVHVGPRALREVFLVPFEAAIRDAQLGSMMNAYSELDGSVVASSRSIMTDLLRGELGFDGMVVSDYHSISMLHDFHHVASDPANAAWLALNAGIDIELPTTKYYGSPLRQAVQSGLVPESLVDTSVERILRKKFELGIFENPYVDVDRVGAAYNQREQRELARQIAVKSLVLLKNEGGLLPLSKTLKTIAVIGPNANQARHLFGDYSHPAHIETMLENKPELAILLKRDPRSRDNVGEFACTPTVLDEIRAHISPDTSVLYAPGCAVNDDNTSGIEQAQRMARQADAVVLVVGDKSGLGMDCTSGESRDRADLGLPGVQQTLVETIVALAKPTVVVLVTGRPLSIAWIAENVPAVIEAWLPGEEGGEAIADVLFGDANPGGKLPVTFPRAVGQVPIFYNHKPSGGHSQWHGDYVSLPTTPLFPFGHGLSYTQFEYANLQIEPGQVQADKHVTIRAEIQNVGMRAGDEVVQLYIRDEVASVPRPVKELKGFKRVHLAPGETSIVQFELPVDMLAFYDEAMHLVVEPGNIRVMLGSSSQDIRLSGIFEIIGQEKRRVPRRIFSGAVRVQ